MPQATHCVSFTLSGGADPQKLDISALIGSTANTDEIVISYCVNSGGQLGGQLTSYPSTPVAGEPYSASITNLNAGDVVEVKIDADVSASVGDMESLSLVGLATITDADDCIKKSNFSEQCDWTAIDSTATVTAPADQLIDNCSDGDPFGPYSGGTFTSSDGGPVSLTFSGEPAGVTFSDAGSGNWTAGGTSPAGGPFIVTVTGSNGSGASDTQTVEIDCGAAGVTFVGACIDDEVQPDPNVYCGFGPLPTGTMGSTGTSVSGDLCGVNVTRVLASANLPQSFYLDTDAPLPSGVTTITISNGLQTVNVPITGGASSYVMPITAGTAATLQIIMSGGFTVSADCP